MISWFVPLCVQYHQLTFSSFRDDNILKGEATRISESVIKYI